MRDNCTKNSKGIKKTCRTCGTYTTCDTFREGFTLIELLIVMGIIAILAGISIVALGGSRESARDARRKADLEQIASGIEIYKSDCNYYPNSGDVSASVTLTGVSPCNPTNANVYIQSIPDDPDSARNYVYQPTPSGCSGTCRGFKLWAYLENPGTIPSYCTAAPSCGSGTCNFCIINP